MLQSLVPNMFNLPSGGTVIVQLLAATVTFTILAVCTSTEIESMLFCLIAFFNPLFVYFINSACQLKPPTLGIICTLYVLHFQASEDHLKVILSHNGKISIMYAPSSKISTKIKKEQCHTNQQKSVKFD